jgi:hypothetical protein
VLDERITIEFGVGSLEPDSEPQGLFQFEYPAYLRRIQRADERTRTAFLISSYE